jgi:GNAT superfamily N-acetyltransferase
MIIAAAAGRFPAVDGGWHRVPPWRPGLEAVFAFTGHAVLALADERSESTLGNFAVDGFGGAHDPRLVSALAGADGWIDSLDLVLAGRGTGRNMEPDLAGLVPRPDLASHPRARYAATIRSAPRAFGYSDLACSTVVILSEGVAGLGELSFELDPSQRGTGQGTALVRDALRLIPDGELVVASVAPGNAASLRCLLATGFTPLGSIQLFRRAPV